MFVQDVMQTKLFTVTPGMTLPEALNLTARRGIRHLPVLDGERLVGAGEPSARLDVVLGDRPHALAEAVQAVENAGADIASIVTLTNMKGLKEAVIRIRTTNPAPVVWALETEGSPPVVRGGDDGLSAGSGRCRALALGDRGRTRLRPSRRSEPTNARAPNRFPSRPTHERLVRQGRGRLESRRPANFREGA